ncbi:hypothetical protein E3C22_09280 [Jiella endophytica]|uniref:3-oxoacyl-ACP synthase n=1 Tax=Jiella endophytica TaxID=2558362 RepID=A0A4Y8RS39_9HYPH|nr:BrnA antitoxin family protein [Jiella endophytica]TFF25527.1 hypothetical protein E3C22_09280 [Jiella endophytica]
MTKENIVRYSLNELLSKDGGTQDDAPEGPELGPDFWATAELVVPRAKKSIHLRIDQEVYDFFKSQGPGHLTRMGAVLRSYVEAQRRS